MSWIDWGSAPAWVGGTFAGAAAYGALATLRSQKRQLTEQRLFIAAQSEVLELQRKDLQAGAEERRWKQARQVKTSFGRLRRNARRRNSPMNGWRVEVYNASSSPLYEVTVKYGTSKRVPGDVRVTGMGGTAEVAHPVAQLLPFGVLSLWSTKGWDWQYSENVPHVYFTDDAGQRWHTDADGHMRPVGPDEGLLDGYRNAPAVD